MTTTETPQTLVMMSALITKCDQTRRNGYWVCIQDEHQDERHYFVHKTL